MVQRHEINQFDTFNVISTKKRIQLSLKITSKINLLSPIHRHTLENYGVPYLNIFSWYRGIDKSNLKVHDIFISKKLGKERIYMSRP